MDYAGQDIADAITASLAKDGQTVPTANLPMGTFKHTGAGDASASGEYVNFGQFISGSYTPTLTPSAGSASAVSFSGAIFCQINKLVFVQVAVTWTQSAASADSIEISLPVQPSSTSQGFHCLVSVDAGLDEAGFCGVSTTAGTGRAAIYRFDRSPFLTGTTKRIFFGGAYFAS
jgi:hypothetical protein